MCKTKQKRNTLYMRRKAENLKGSMSGHVPSHHGANDPCRQLVPHGHPGGGAASRIPLLKGPHVRLRRGVPRGKNLCLLVVKHPCHENDNKCPCARVYVCVFEESRVQSTLSFFTMEACFGRSGLPKDDSACTVTTVCEYL